MNKNSRLKQSTINFNLKLFRNINLGFVKGRILMNIYNLFDKRNENNVWSDSGRAGVSRIIENALINESKYEEILRPNTVKDYYNHPEWYSNPREIQFGFEIVW